MARHGGEMSQESFADLILVKLLRIKQILLNDGKNVDKRRH